MTTMANDGATTPTNPPPHGGRGTAPRGLLGTPGSFETTGRFGRMFRNLPVYDVPDAVLARLGAAMIQPPEDDKPLDVPDTDENTATLDNDGGLRLPAGYTYFGQFVDHDITFDPVSSLTRQNDPDALTDYRTPRFDLDSVYGRGSADQPYMYQPDGVHLVEGNPVGGGTEVAGPDLPRNANERAIIGDPRNDENLIVSQLQVAMIRFHNTVVDLIAAGTPGLPSDELLKRAQQQVRWHYQWIVVHDFLPRLVGDAVVTDILGTQTYVSSDGPVTIPKAQPRFYRWHDKPYMPVEFSVAAYRFGHSMIRPSYKINDVAETSPPIEGVNRIRIFGNAAGDGELQSLRGFRKLPDSWGVQWKYFLPGLDTTETVAPTHLPQPSYKIDAELSNPLGKLADSTAGPEPIVDGFPPDIAQDLAVRNLLRGKRLALPAGQDVANAMGIAPLTEDELFGDIAALDDDDKAALAGKCPLWFYILKEAGVRQNGEGLGPVGGRIVAEVLIGLLSGDSLSYLKVDPHWVPELPGAQPDHFTLSDLIRTAFPPPPTPTNPPPPNPYGS